MRVHWTLWIERPIFKTWPGAPFLKVLVSLQTYKLVLFYEMLGSNLSVGSHSGGGGRVSKTSNHLMLQKTE